MQCIIADAPTRVWGMAGGVTQSVGGCPCAPDDADVGADTHALLTLLRGLLTLHPLTFETHETGLGLAERYGLSTFDGMIAASALHTGCETLWSEDMQHGMTLGDGPRVVNPFRVAG